MCQSQNIIPLFHKKVISHDPLQQTYPNLGRTCKNKFYENKIKLITDTGAKKPPCQIRLMEYNKSNIFFFKNHARNEAGRLVPGLFLVFKIAFHEVKPSGLPLSFIYFNNPHLDI